MYSRKLLIVGNYGAGNLGDDAILGGILEDLKAIGFTGDIQVCSGGERTTHEVYKQIQKVPFTPVGIRSRFNREKCALAQKAFSEASLAIVGGGGLFTDGESWKAPYIWYKQVSNLIKNKVPYLIYGQSFGPLKGFWARYWARKACQHALAIHVRDRASKELLEEWDFTPYQGTDPAFSWLMEEKQKRIKKEEVLLLALRSWPGIGVKEWKMWAKPINEYAKKKKLKVIALNMQVSQENDEKIWKDLGWELYSPRSAREALFAFQKAKEALTMRLHGGIFGVVAKTPMHVLSYSQKVACFFEALSEEKLNLVHQTDSLDEERLRRILKTEPQTIHPNLEAKIQENRQFLERFCTI